MNDKRIKNGNIKSSSIVIINYDSAILVYLSEYKTLSC